MTATKERTDLARLTGAVDSLAGVKDELAALCAASRAAEGAEEVQGIAQIVHRLHREVSDNLTVVTGVQTRLRENGASPQEHVNHLAYLALQAAGMARHLVPEIGSVQDTTDAFRGDVEKAIRKAFEAVGMEGEIPQSFAESASADARRRLEGRMEDLPDSSVGVKLTRRDVRALNVLISAAILASDGTLGMMTELPYQEITPRPVRVILRAVLEHTETAIEKIEGASPYSGDELLDWRGDALKELVMEATEGMES